MLAIRLQRVGRKGLAIYRIAVQEAQRHPSSGRVVAYVGTYNPHTKEVNVNVETMQKHLDNGAQPTPRIVKLLAGTDVKLPSWVKTADDDKKKSTKNTEKLRKHQPKEDVVEEAAEEPAAEEPVTADEK
jgi:small subunit ribosomal protein S16